MSVLSCVFYNIFPAIYGLRETTATDAPVQSPKVQSCHAALCVLRLALLASFSYKGDGGHTNTRRSPEGHGGLRGRQGRKYLRSFNEACIFMDSG